MTSFLYSFACLSLTSIKGRLNRTWIPSIKDSLETNKVQGTGSHILHRTLSGVDLMGLRPPSVPLATKTSLSTSLAEIVHLWFLTEISLGGLFPRPGRQASVTGHVKLVDGEWLLDHRAERDPDFTVSLMENTGPAGLLISSKGQGKRREQHTPRIFYSCTPRGAQPFGVSLKTQTLTKTDELKKKGFK